jgi:hypothetical protein
VTKRPAITGIAFARFYTTDPCRAQKFYGDTLGYKRLEANGVWTYPVNRSQWVEILTLPAPPSLTFVWPRSRSPRAMQRGWSVTGRHTVSRRRYR